MKPSTPVYLALAFAAGVAVVQPAQRWLQPAVADTAPAPTVVAPVVAEVAPAPAPFKPVVKHELVKVEPTHGHLVQEILQCQSDACALEIVASTGLNEIEGSVAIWGDTKLVYTAQLEEGGPWVTNPDMDGDGHWSQQDMLLLDQLSE